MIRISFPDRVLTPCLLVPELKNSKVPRQQMKLSSVGPFLCALARIYHLWGLEPLIPQSSELQEWEVLGPLVGHWE